MNYAASARQRAPKNKKASNLETEIQALTLELTKAKEALQTAVADRNRMEQELAKSEEKFQTLLESASEGIVAIDPSGRIALVNGRAEAMFGYERTELIGQFIEILLPARFRDVHTRHRLGYFTEPRTRPMGQGLDLLGLRKDGTEFPVEVGLGFVKIGKDHLATSFVTDITERKRDEENLLKLAAIVESSNDAIIGKTLKGIIVNWNKAAERIYGYANQEVVGQPVSMLASANRADEIPQILDRIGRGESVNNFETTHRRKDGTHIDVSLTISPLMDAAGRIIGASAISRDITAQKKAAEVAHLQELRLLQADRMASLGILVSGMAHEINNPNNYILLNSRMLFKVWNDVKPILAQHYEKAGDFHLAGMPYSQAHEQIGQLVSGIIDGTLRIQKIVQSLKDFARNDTGSLNQVVNVNVVIQNGVVIMSSLIKKSTDFFSIEYGKDLPPVQGNAQQLEQVIINLVSNACQALPSRQKKVTVSTRFVKEADKIMIAVQDEGMGISSENLKFILDPFFTTKRDAGGTGLGLSTSHAIVKNHGGELTFSSQPGKGTTATVMLPIAQK
jgi:PAS domain S-box-containing protein